MTSCMSDAPYPETNLDGGRRSPSDGPSHTIKNGKEYNESRNGWYLSRTGTGEIELAFTLPVYIQRYSIMNMLNNQPYFSFIFITKNDFGHRYNLIGFQFLKRKKSLMKSQQEF